MVCEEVEEWFGRKGWWKGGLLLPLPLLLVVVVLLVVLVLVQGWCIGSRDMLACGFGGCEVLCVLVREWFSVLARGLARRVWLFGSGQGG